MGVVRATAAMKGQATNPRLERGARSGLWRGIMDLTFLLYGAGGGLFSSLGLMAAGLWPGRASRGDFLRELGERLVQSLRANPYPGALVAASAISAAFSPAPALAWGAYALLVFLAVLFWLLVAQKPDGAEIRAWVGQWAAGAVILAGVGLGSFLANRTMAAPEFVGKNGLGTLLAVSLPLLQYQIAAGAAALSAGVSTLFVATVLFLSMSQGGWIGAFVGQFALLVWGSPRMRRVAAALLLLAVLVAAGIGVYIVANKIPAYEMLETRLDAFSHSKTERLLIWRSSLAMFRDHPLWGVGLGAFSAVYPQYRLPQASEPVVSFAHNVVLNLLAETGILGFAAFLTMAVSWLRRVGTVIREGPDRDLGAAVLAALLAMLTHQLFDGTMWSVQIGVGFWMLGAMAVALEQRAHEREAVKDVG